MLRGIFGALGVPELEDQEVPQQFEMRIEHRPEDGFTAQRWRWIDTLFDHVLKSHYHTSFSKVWQQHLITNFLIFVSIAIVDNSDESRFACDSYR